MKLIFQYSFAIIFSARFIWSSPEIGDEYRKYLKCRYYEDCPLPLNTSSSPIRYNLFSPKIGEYIYRVQLSSDKYLYVGCSDSATNADDDPHLNLTGGSINLAELYNCPPLNTSFIRHIQTLSYLTIKELQHRSFKPKNQFDPKELITELDDITRDILSKKEVTDVFQNFCEKIYKKNNKIGWQRNLYKYFITSPTNPEKLNSEYDRPTLDFVSTPENLAKLEFLNLSASQFNHCNENVSPGLVRLSVYNENYRPNIDEFRILFTVHIYYKHFFFFPNDELSSCIIQKEELILYFSRRSLFVSNILHGNYRSLYELRLQKDKISFIPENTFWGCFTLEKLNIAENALKNLSRSMFRDQVNLVSLNLRWNKIEDIPDNIFENLTKLDDLDLRNNCIQNISR